MASAAGVILALATTANAQFDFTALFKALSPQPLFIPQYEYEGLEFRYGRFVFRPAQFFPELIILGFLVFYATSYVLGSRWNSRKANAWYNAHIPVFEAQFTKPGLPNTIINDGAADMFQHATGRRGVTSLHTVFNFIPRHDLFQIVFTYGWTLYDLRYDPKDSVLLDFKLATSPNDSHAFVWGIVGKDFLRTIKNDRWDLTLTKTQENPVLNDQLVVMSEQADITETFFKHQAFQPVLQALKDPKVLTHFRSLSITDQPTRRPYNGPMKPHRRQRHVYLSLSTASPSQATDTLPLVKAVFNFIDLLESPNKFTFRPETTRKLKATREGLDKELLKDITEEKEKEAEDEKRAAKRRAEEERVAKLSAEQQRKHMEKEKKRAQKKSQSARVKMG